MEKFTEWRDPGTGIAPFTPVVVHDRSNVIIKAGKVLIKTVFIIGRLPLLLVSLLLYLLLPILFIRKLILLYILNFLFSFNVFGSTLVDVSIEGIKRSDNKSIRANLPHVNDFIIVNYVSPLDSLVLYVLNPSSVFLMVGPDNQLHKLSMWQFFKSTLSQSSSIIGSPVKIESLKNQVVYLFAEGTPSNGKSILPYNVTNTALSLADYSKDFKFKVLTLRLSPAELTTPIPCLFAGYTCLLLSNTGKLRYKVRLALVDSNVHELSWDKLRNTSAETGRLRLVGKELNIESKKRFVTAYQKNKKS